MNKRNYRKICHDCGNPFKGRKDAKFCCDLCRVRHGRKYRSSSIYKQISAILSVEFDGMNLNDAQKLVKICISAIKRAKRSNLKYGDKLIDLPDLSRQDSKTPMGIEEKKEIIRKLLKK